MSIHLLSSQNVVRLLGTRRDSINTVATDFLNVGAANALEIPPPVPARFAVGSAALERQSLLATPILGATAVRQHGGGLARRAPLTQQPGGRRARSIGGEIKSLCCAAAGIIALAPRPCRVHAYPPTGVRRAAHPPAPLRSSPRSHAQPVKGYPNAKIHFLLEYHSLSTFSLGASQLGQAQVLCLTDNAGVLQRGNVRQEPDLVVGHAYGAPQGLDIRPCLFYYRDATEHRIDQPMRYCLIQHQPHRFSGTQNALGGNPLRSEQLSVSTFLKREYGLLTSALTYPCDPGLLRIRNCFFSFSGLLMATLRNPNGDKNGANRANSLNPSRPSHAILNGQHYHPHRCKQHNGTRHRGVCLKQHNSLLEIHTANPLVHRHRLKAKRGDAVESRYQQVAE